MVLTALEITVLQPEFDSRLYSVCLTNVNVEVGLGPDLIQR